jgi:hypothetical protein
MTWAVEDRVKAKRHPLELPEAKQGNDGHLGHIGWPDQDLILSFAQVQLREHPTPMNLADRSCMLGTGYLSGVVIKLRRL